MATQELPGTTSHALWKSRELRARRAYGIEILGGCCARCGNDIKSELQFDHIDRLNRSFGINRSAMYSMERFKNELKKCRLLCIYCHSWKSNAERRGVSLEEIETAIQNYQEATANGDEDLPF